MAPVAAAGPELAKEAAKASSKPEVPKARTAPESEAGAPPTTPEKAKLPEPKTPPKARPEQPRTQPSRLARKRSRLGSQPSRLGQASSLRPSSLGRASLEKGKRCRSWCPRQQRRLGSQSKLRCQRKGQPAAEAVKEAAPAVAEAGPRAAAADEVVSDAVRARRASLLAVLSARRVCNTLARLAGEADLALREAAEQTWGPGSAAAQLDPFAG